MLRTEEMKGDLLVMSAEMARPGDKNSVYALIEESARAMVYDPAWKSDTIFP